ncbi:MAG: YggL family protein [Aquabacterium sp.]|uniref:YggL 50S ribosome-binding family protein n=1 Tax=Aquabacterium sp. TaxID=1872578 RepID=UPI00271ADDFA|nr:YggL family protein [Aquabacterium sp.]MDO9005963.1 YggL family protein [Aquabacterium sp.]
MAKTRSRRLRKKLHVGEFQQLGFLFEAELAPDADDEALVDSFLTQAIGPRNLSFGGWATGGAIDKLGRQSVTEDDRSAVLTWLAARPEVTTLSASGLVDMWYSTPEAQQRTKLKG